MGTAASNRILQYLNTFPTDFSTSWKQLQYLAVQIHLLYVIAVCNRKNLKSAGLDKIQSEMKQWLWTMSGQQWVFIYQKHQRNICQSISNFPPRHDVWHLITTIQVFSEALKYLQCMYVFTILNVLHILSVMTTIHHQSHHVFLRSFAKQSVYMCSLRQQQLSVLLYKHNYLWPVNKMSYILFQVTWYARTCKTAITTGQYKIPQRHAFRHITTCS